MTALTTVLEHHNTIENALQDPASKKSYQCIEKQMNTKAKSFKIVQKRNMNTMRKIQIITNLFERMTGFDITPGMANML